MDNEKTIKEIYHARDLRKGRHSCAGLIYLVTTVTKNRKYFFLDFDKARILINCLRKAESRHYATSLAYVVMPDHLHWVLELGKEKSLSETVAYIKGLSAYRIHRTREGHDFAWQEGFHDHGFRNDENLLSSIRYVIANPLRAGLVHKIGGYSHWDCVYLRMDRKIW